MYIFVYFSVLSDHKASPNMMMATFLVPVSKSQLKFLIRDIYSPSTFTQEKTKLTHSLWTQRKFRSNLTCFFVCAQNWGQSLNLQGFYFYYHWCQKTSFSFIHCTDVKTAIPSSTDQRTEDRNLHEERQKKAGLTTPTTGQVKRNPEVSSRLESHPRQVE